MMQIVLLPLCTAIANGPIAKGCFAVATMALALRIYLETFEAPNAEVSHSARQNDTKP